MVTLVTGAPGWLGMRLLRELHDREVRCLLQRGVDSSPLEEFPVDVYEGDLRDPGSLRRAFQDVDVVFHLAAVIKSPVVRRYFDTNAQGTLHLVEQAVASDVKRFLHVSSDAAFGACEPGQRFLHEADTPRPLSAYGRSKLQAEAHVTAAHGEQGLRTTIIRPFWMYGPGQPPRMSFLMRMIRRGTAPVVGDGRMLRSMTNVDDTVAALLMAEGSRRTVGQDYFIADERPYSVLEIYGSIASALGVPLRTIRIPPAMSWCCQTADRLSTRLGYQFAPLFTLAELRHNIVGSIDKAREDFGYRPRGILQDGMTAAVEWATCHGCI